MRMHMSGAARPQLAPGRVKYNTSCTVFTNYVDTHDVAEFIVLRQAVNR